MFTLILLTSLKVVVVLLGSLVRSWRDQPLGNCPAISTYSTSCSYCIIIYHILVPTLYIYICCIYVTYIYIHTYEYVYRSIHRHTCLFYMQICILTDGAYWRQSQLEVLREKRALARPQWMLIGGFYLILFVQTIQNSRGLSFYHILSDIPPAKFLQTTWPPSSTITTTYTWGYYRPGSKTVAFFIGNSSESRNDIFGQTLAQERDACITRITFW